MVVYFDLLHSSAVMNSVIVDIEQSILPSPSSIVKEVEEIQAFTSDSCNIESCEGWRTSSDTGNKKYSLNMLGITGGEEVMEKVKESTTGGIIKEEKEEEKEGEEEEEEGEEEEAVFQQSLVLRRSGRNSRNQRDSVSISELAKKVRLRVKRGRRAAKTILAGKRNTVPEVKVVKAKPSLGEKGSNVSEVKVVEGKASEDNVLEEKEGKVKPILLEAVSEFKEVISEPSLSNRRDVISEISEVRTQPSILDQHDIVSEVEEVTVKPSCSNKQDAVSEINELRTQPIILDKQDSVSEVEEVTKNTCFVMDKRDAVPEVMEVNSKPSLLGKQDIASEAKEVENFESDSIHNTIVVQNLHTEALLTGVQESSDRVDCQASQSVGELPCDHEAPSNSGIIIAESLKEKILRKSREKSARYCLDNVRFDESNRNYHTTTRVETSVENDRCLASTMVTELSSLAQSLDADTEQCISVKGHINYVATDDVFTENKVRTCEDNEYSSRDSSQKEHDNLMHDDSPDNANFSRGCSDREYSTMHGRCEGQTTDMSKLNVREKSVPESPVPDEPPGFSLSGRTMNSHPDRCTFGSNHAIVSERSTDMYGSRMRGSISAYGLSSLNNGSEHAHSKKAHEQCPDRFKSGIAINHTSESSLSKRSCFQGQAPSMPCDIAEGHMWQIGEGSEQGEESEGGQLPCHSNVPDNRFIGGPSFAYDNQCIESNKYDNRYYEAQGCAMDYFNHYDESQGHTLGYVSQRNEPQKYGLKLPDAGCTPFNHLIQLNWKWSSDVGSEKPNNHIKIVKERSVFVGCIPDGIENLDLLLRTMMEQFLERFDFAPARLGQVQLIKTVKDFAFIELATEKVAQIVLSVNQLDVFEWGINGYHFNIQGCTATYTSVRPLIEYMPLRPARVVFVGNIPKFRWQQDYLESYFSTVLRGSDGPTDWKYVSRVYLLPESSDAYVEMTSELMADALMFKCAKVPEVLREIGPDVFICRDTRSVPLMSRHKGTICPQRSLYIGIAPPGVDFKIDYVMKTIGEILPFIARNSNQRGYLEYVNLQPGKDYAFFQFNTEAFVDAIMDEYIENTQIFICRESKVPYIILRPPGYVRPGAGYGSNIHNAQPFVAELSDSEGSKRARSVSLDPNNNVGLKLRRFGDEPVKKPDCIISIGASPIPSANWNESSTGLRSNNHDCMIVIEGLSIQHNYRLIRGALNELFERSLWHTGQLEVGMLVVRYLEQDGNFAVATLTNPEFVSTLLSMRKVFVLAGQEIRLLPKDCRRNFNWKGNPADLSGAHCELSSLSDDESQERAITQKSYNEYNADRIMQNDIGYSETNCKYPQQYGSSGRRNMDDQNPPGYDRISRRNMNDPNPPGYDRISRRKMDDGMYTRSVSRQRDEGSRNGYREISQWHNAKTQHQNVNAQVKPVAPFPKPCEGNNPRARVPHNQKGTGFLNSSGLRGEECGSRIRKQYPDEGFRIMSRDGKRAIHNPSICEAEELIEMGKKRKAPEVVQENMKRFNNRRMNHHISMFP